MSTRKIGVSTLRRLVREATAGERAREINVTSAKDRPQGATFWTELPEDQEYWEKQWGVKTGEDLDRTLAIQTYSDVYKELYGSRPSVSSLKSMPVDKIEAMIDELYASGADEDYDYAPTDDYEYNFAPEVTPEDPDDEYASYASPKSSGMGRRLEAFVGFAKGRWALVVEAARKECDECEGGKMEVDECGMEEVSEADENEVDECGDERSWVRTR